MKWDCYDVAAYSKLLINISYLFIIFQVATFSSPDEMSHGSVIMQDLLMPVKTFGLLSSR